MLWYPLLSGLVNIGAVLPSHKRLCGICIKLSPGVLLRRKDVLPVINKRWARLLRGCSPAWRVAKITHTAVGMGDVEDESEDDSEEPLNSAAVLGWFTSRPG